MQHLFVYGSLIFPELIKKLTGERFRFIPTVLHGFKRHAVKGCDYPAIIQRKGANVEGLLVLNVDEESMDILTFYEGEDYEIIDVEVVAEEKKYKAITFVWAADLFHLEDFDWEPDFFKENSLQLYADRIVPETRRDFTTLQG